MLTGVERRRKNGDTVVLYAATGVLVFDVRAWVHMHSITEVVKLLRVLSKKAAATSSSSIEPEELHLSSFPLIVR